MRSLLLIIVLVYLPSLLPGEDTKFYPRQDGSGYDFFDFSGLMVGQSFRNEKGSYDFRDRFGRLVGWADASISGRITFHDAAGAIYRIIDQNIDGSSIIYDANGVIINHTSPTYIGLGGIQNYDAQAYATSFGLYGAHITPSPPPSPSPEP